MYFWNLLKKLKLESHWITLMLFWLLNHRKKNSGKLWNFRQLVYGPQTPKMTLRYYTGFLKELKVQSQIKHLHSNQIPDQSKINLTALHHTRLLTDIVEGRVIVPPFLPVACHLILDQEEAGGDIEALTLSPILVGAILDAFNLSINIGEFLKLNCLYVFNINYWKSGF
eukprot:NODE_38_length_35257_cov_0.939047.p26 type:complete len:169 gc:universal NODE_38_length_35257_cov_0.939047:16124-15618(-)